MMVFAPEDKRAWRDSEVMAEFEKAAREANLLDGGPPEAFLPIPEKVAEQATWEDEDVPEPVADPNQERRAQLAEHGMQLTGMIEKMAQDLAEAGHTKAAYRLERALGALRDIVNAGGK